MEGTVFRKKTMESISSPEQLTDYLRVTNPGIWIILSAVILFLAGILAWSAVGTLETTVDGKITVSDGRAAVVLISAQGTELKSGMALKVASEEYIISDVETDDYGRTVGYASVSLPDGNYDADIVTEEIHPISFLLEGR